MHYEPRTLALVVELIHPPLKPDARAVQALHNEAWSGGQPPWSSFQVGPDGVPQLVNPARRVGEISQTLFLPDRILMREENTGRTSDEFSAILDKLAGDYARSRAIPIFLAQAVTLRALVTTHHHEDARHFLAGELMALEKDLDVFKRTPATVGLRLAFMSANAAEPAINLRIESWNQDPRSVFIDLQTTFGPRPLQDIGTALGDRVHETYAILEREVLPLVARHDRALP